MIKTLTTEQAIEVENNLLVASKALKCVYRQLSKVDGFDNTNKAVWANATDAEEAAIQFRQYAEGG